MTQIETLDELIKKSENSSEHLEELLTIYADLAAASKPDFIANYFPQLDKVYSIWETDLELAKGLRNISKAITCFYQTKFDQTIAPVTLAIDLFSKLEHKNLLGLSYMITGANYRSLGEIDEAVKYLYLGIDNIDSEGSLALYKCYCFYQLAEINVSIKDHQAARTNYLKAAEMAEKINNNTALFRAYNGLGNLFIVEKNYPEALDWLNKTLTISGVTDSQRSRTFCDLGVYYAHTNELKLARDYFEKSVKIRKNAGLMDAASTALIGLGETLLKLGLTEEAIPKLNEALVICKEFNSRQKLLNCYRLLAQAFKKNKDWELSVDAYDHYDSIQQEVSSKQLQKIYKLKNNKIAEQKKQIEEILKEVHDSINYAKGIQQAILPSDSLVKNNLPNSFILYQPKDVVSGDFYWLEVVDDTIIYAAADCTGHGVPGALVSVVCVNALNRSVREFELKDPAQILEKTREIILQTFERSDHEVKDGMDIALCALNKENNVLQYAGAHNPLWISRDGELIETKADKQPVGKHTELNPFTTHTIELKKEDIIYTFTDGFVDQFGGPKGKKYKAKAFKKLLLSIRNKSISEQRSIISQEFENWKGSLEQLDDVCIIGVKV